MLNEKLKQLHSYPFHMPGHKRNRKFGLPAAEMDITEISGFDDLHNPAGDIKELESDIADTFGYKKSLISVNGSTCGILAAISAVCNYGDKIIIARNCHKSVYNACLIRGLDAVYIEPEFNEEFGVYTYITQNAIDKAVKENPNAKAIVITSPTYEGFISEISSSIPLIIDAAHGAHFGFADWLCKRANGDIVIQSLHKTLPCLTQTAVVHINNEKYFNSVKKYMDIFESSSPSYILLSAVESCIQYLKTAENDFKEYKKTLDDFYNKIQKLEHIKLLKNDDLTRIVISAKGFSGTELAEELRKNNIEPEGATLNYVILISTIGDTQNGFDQLYNMLKALKCNEKEFECFNQKNPCPVKACKSCEVLQTAVTDLDSCTDKVSAATVFAYPPGVPIITAGEIISKEIVDYIKLCVKNGVNIIDTDNLLPESLLTKTE